MPSRHLRNKKEIVCPAPPFVCLEKNILQLASAVLAGKDVIFHTFVYPAPPFVCLKKNTAIGFCSFS